MTDFQLIALVIPYSGNTKVRCDPGVSLDTFYINKCNFCYPFLPLLGILSRVKATLRLLPLDIPYSGTRRYDMTLVMILQLVSPYSEKPTVRHVSEFNLGSFT